jgi:hypothetical protein
MQHIETLSGEGSVTAPDGQSLSVSYRLDIFEDLNESGTTPGKKSIQGKVLPLCFFGRAGLILKMADGRTLRFYFADAAGKIVACSGIT